VTVERYPELKSNQNFLALQSQLEGTENRIAVERRRFNESVREYNTRLRLFPGSVVASMTGFRPKAFFEAAADAATPPKVKF
jgi:LemA protein